MADCPSKSWLLVLPAAMMVGCMTDSGRFDPFPGSAPPLRPESRTVGLVRFQDATEHPQEVRRRVRVHPPPRRLYEEALAVALGRKGFTALLLDVSPEASPDTRMRLARALQLDAVVTGRILACEEKFGPRFQMSEVRTKCLLEVEARDVSGRVIFRGRGIAEETGDIPGMRVDKLHETWLQCIERSAERAVEDLQGDLAVREGSP